MYTYSNETKGDTREYVIHIFLFKYIYSIIITYSVLISTYMCKINFIMHIIHAKCCHGMLNQ